MVFRVNKTENYTVMSNYHLREKEMSLKAKGLLSWMLSNTDNWDYSIQGIVANCKENETAIESALNELKKFGYLTVTKLTPDKTESGRYEYIYDIHEYPIQGVEKQGVEFLPLEIQGVENQVQRNTKEINTNKEILNNNTILKDSTAKKRSPIVNNSNTFNMPKRNIVLMDSVNDKAYGNEKEEKQKEKKLNMYQKCILEIDNYTADETLKQALKDYLSIRLKITGDKKLLGVSQWKGMLNKLSILKGDKVSIVKEATANGWAAFYDHSDSKTYKSTKPNKSVFGEFDSMKTIRPEEVEGGEFSGQIF